MKIRMFFRLHNITPHIENEEPNFLWAQNRIIQQNTLENKQGSNWAPKKQQQSIVSHGGQTTHTQISSGKKSPIFFHNMSRPTNTVKSHDTTLF